MGVTFRGEEPLGFLKNERQRLLKIINQEASQIETELVEAASEDVNTGRLKGSWNFRPATEQSLVAKISTSVNYFLAVEIGRSPGKGISKVGQEDVSRWAQLKLGLGDKESKSFAFLLSRKYKEVGRESTGKVGLIKPGVVPSAGYKLPKNPVQGSLLANAFARLKRELQS